MGLGGKRADIYHMMVSNGRRPWTHQHQRSWVSEDWGLGDLRGIEGLGRLVDLRIRDGDTKSYLTELRNFKRYITMIKSIIN